MKIGFFDCRERIPSGEMQTAFTNASDALKLELQTIQPRSASLDEKQPNDAQAALIIATAQSILYWTTTIEQKESRIPYLLCGSCCNDNNFTPPWEALTHIFTHTTYMLACLTNPTNDEKDQQSLEKISKDLKELQYWRSRLEEKTQFSFLASSYFFLMIALPFILFAAGESTLQEATALAVGFGSVFGIPFIFGTIALMSLLPSLWRVHHLQNNVNTLTATAQAMFSIPPTPDRKTEVSETGVYVQNPIHKEGHYAAVYDGTKLVGYAVPYTQATSNVALYVLQAADDKADAADYLDLAPQTYDH